MQLAQFDYIFAIAVIFAFLDAWNIGANDVANSFASSISSRALKYWQAMVLAGICEFLGAVLAGSRVADTIKSKIMDISQFQEEPAVLMLAMACALIGSSLWLTLATSIGMPVSTTHSIVGGTIGAGIAAIGAKNIHWGWSGVSQIIASWFIAPAIAGCFASIVFLVSKYAVLERKNAVRNGLWLAPCLVYLTFSILTMLIVWKGAPNLKLDKLSGAAIVGSIFGVGAVATLLYMLFVFPVMKRKLMHNDWTLKWYSVCIGPVYYFKSVDNIPPMPAGHMLVIDYYAGRRGEEPLEATESNDEEEGLKEIANVDAIEEHSENARACNAPAKLDSEPKLTTRQLWWYLLKQGPSQWGHLAWLMIKHGWDQDIISSQATDKDALCGDLKGMFSRAKFYDNKLEHLFSLLQAVTACTMSFAHGSNDIANAAGPLSTVYTVWKTNTVSSKSDVPIWVLCFTAGSLVLGCWTYGYRIMRNLGNKLTLQSPSRGFAIELGAAVTTVMATQLGIPISTTQCAVGATVFVGLCNKDIRAVNWRMVMWCYLGWFVTLPCSGIVSGVLCGIILNAPRYGGNYTLS